MDSFDRTPIPLATPSQAMAPSAIISMDFAVPRLENGLFPAVEQNWSPPRPAEGNIILKFSVSMNEEHTFLKVADGAQAEFDLGERAHHYCLLTLARRRLLDARAGLDTSSQGWIGIDQLCRMLGVEPAHLNIQIFRARMQLARVLKRGKNTPEIIERRRGELRFGALPFRIERGTRIEGDSSQAHLTWEGLAAHSPLPPFNAAG